MLPTYRLTFVATMYLEKEIYFNSFIQQQYSQNIPEFINICYL